MTPISPRTSFLAACAAALALAAGCTNPDQGCTAVLKATGNPDNDHAALQGALDGAQANAVVCLVPGLFRLTQTVTATSASLTLTSNNDGVAVLDFTGQPAGQGGLRASGTTGLRMKNLTVLNAGGDGVTVSGADLVELSGLVVTWTGGASAQNGANGIAVVGSTRVKVDNDKASYAAAAGILVQKSSHILVTGDESFGNGVGIDVENSDDVEVTATYFHENAGGVLVAGVPATGMDGGHRAFVHGNHIVANTVANLAPAGSTVAAMPTGSGIVVVAHQGGEFSGNNINGNSSDGILLVSFAVTGLADTAPGDTTFNGFAQGNFVHDNVLSGDGALPAGLARTLATGAGLSTIPELVWDGVVDATASPTDATLTNCFAGNGGADFADLGLGALPGTLSYRVSRDLTPFACTHPSLSPQVF